MKKNAKCPIFIFGYPRSGTTLLWALLNAHSRISLVLEPELIRGMVSAGLDFSGRVKRENYGKLLGKMKKIGLTEQYLSSLPDGTLSDFVKLQTDLSFKEIYEFLLPVSENAEIWGEKSLGNIFYISKLSRLYPNAAFINIIRDPRAVLLSHYRKKYADSKPLEPTFATKEIRFFAQSTLLWKQWLAAAENARTSLENALMIQIRYEDIVNEPEKNLRQICDAVGIDFEPEMLEASRRKNNSIKKDWAYAHQNLNQPINSERAKAGSELPAWASYIVEKYASDELKKLNYSSAQNGIGLKEKLTIEAQLLIYNKKIKSDVDRKISYRKPVYKAAEQTTA